MTNLKEAFFCIEGDNVFFRGLDSEKMYGKYPCPLFDSGIARTAAGYLSTGNRYFTLIENRLYIVTANEMKEVDVYEVNGKHYWDFSGWHWIKYEIK